MSNKAKCCDFIDSNYLINVSAKLNNDVVEQINAIQEMCMLETFGQKSSQFQLQKLFELRMSEISSWRWVLDDLSKRLDEAIGLLGYERNAVVVVRQRLNEEISIHSKLSSKPGVLKPYDDDVEATIMKEYKILCQQRACFDKILNDLDKKILFTKNTKRRISEDLLRKTSALSLVEGGSEQKKEKIKRKKLKSKENWEGCCASLKSAGLKALKNAFLTREQVRYARVNLSIVAQAAASRVDNGLRRRLHQNKVKLDDLNWHREEVRQESITLTEEIITNEKTIIGIIDQIRSVETRIQERKHGPPGEVIKDESDRKLHEELVRLKRSAKELNVIIQNTRKLQNDLNQALLHIDCCIEDLRKIVELDKNRIRCRQNIDEPNPNASMDSPQLDVIYEEDECA